MPSPNAATLRVVTHALGVARVEVDLPEVPGECVISLLQWTRHERLRSTSLTVFLMCLTVRGCSRVAYSDIRGKQGIQPDGHESGRNYPAPIPANRPPAEKFAGSGGR